MAENGKDIEAERLNDSENRGAGESNQTIKDLQDTIKSTMARILRSLRLI